jgi:HK97 family phage prohead protease
MTYEIRSPRVRVPVIDPRFRRWLGLPLELKSGRRADDQDGGVDLLDHTEIRFEVKADAIEAEKRQFTGLASTWDLDLGGDVIEKGAYSRTLRDWKSSGRLIPLINQHHYFDAKDAIGKLIAAKQTETGLETTFQVVNSAEGDEYLARIKDGILNGLSIGYETRAWRPPSEAERKRGVFRVLEDVELKEVSLVIWGMNQNALIDAASVKMLTATVAKALASLKRDDLSDEDRKTVRTIAAQCGALLREDAPNPPKDPPAKRAADDTTAYPATEALNQRILALRLDRTIRAGRRL